MRDNKIAAIRVAWVFFGGGGSETLSHSASLAGHKLRDQSVSATHACQPLVLLRAMCVYVQS